LRQDLHGVLLEEWVLGGVELCLVDGAAVLQDTHEQMLILGLHLLPGVRVRPLLQ
jgi:hypothetical protein